MAYGMAIRTTDSGCDGPARSAMLSSTASMPRTTLAYSKTAVDQAGDVLVSDQSVQVDATGAFDMEREFERSLQIERAFSIINNWRSSHSFPLNTLSVGLRRISRQIDPNSLVAQRIKRLVSIELKLRRFSTMKLSQMQDIGGCRAIVASIKDVDAVVKAYAKSEIRHKIDHTDDYIRKPQKSGYRGVHLIWRYYSDRSTAYNGLKIEMQLRSPLQHAWATAVETVGTFVRQALKSSQGEKEWLRFFALMGSALALREGTEPVPNTPTERDTLTSDLRNAAYSLDVANRLTSFGAALQTLEQPSAKKAAQYYLLALDPKAENVSIRGFRQSELEAANAEYLKTERGGADAVLVSVESLGALRRAYPNYFLDTRVFLDALKQAIA